MQRYLTLAIVIATCADATVFGQNVLRLYPEKKLQADAARWSEQIQAEYRETILPQLTDEERSALGAIKIEVPLQDPMAIRSHSTPTTRARFTCRRFRYGSFRISARRTPGSMLTDTTALPCAIMSVCSCARQTLSPGAPLPPVFRTLGVPDNAREESAVANRVDRNFGNTIVFFLAHELGHASEKTRHPFARSGSEAETGNRG